MIPNVRNFSIPTSCDELNSFTQEICTKQYSPNVKETKHQGSWQMTRMWSLALAPMQGKRAARFNQNWLGYLVSKGTVWLHFFNPTEAAAHPFHQLISISTQLTSCVMHTPAIVCPGNLLQPHQAFVDKTACLSACLPGPSDDVDRKQKHAQ